VEETALTCGSKIGITVTAEAYAAIKATLPADTQTWPTSPPDQGDVIIWLDQAMLDRLETPSEVVPPGGSRGVTFRYALNMPKLVIKAQQRGAKAPRLGEPTRGLNCPGRLARGLCRAALDGRL
jgi:hypothetical protein